MVRAVLVVLATAAVVATGCGGDDERDGVERYIEAANAIQKAAAPDVAKANQTYAQFSKSELSEVRADLDLTAVEQSIRAMRAKLARLDPPPAALPLHRRLLKVYDLNADFADESTKLARYLPAARRALRPLQGIGEKLRSRLQAAKSPAEQADALDRYARGAYGQYNQLRQLDPPPVLLTSHRSQLQRLFDSSKLAWRIRQATLARNSEQVARLLLRFREVNARARPTRLTRDAVRAYDERYRDITAAVTAMQQEQIRLQQRFA